MRDDEFLLTGEQIIAAPVTGFSQIEMFTALFGGEIQILTLEYIFVKTVDFTKDMETCLSCTTLLQLAQLHGLSLKDLLISFLQTRRKTKKS